MLVYEILTCFDIRVWCCRIWRVGLVRDLIMRLGVFVHGVSRPLVCFGTRQGVIRWFLDCGPAQLRY